MFSGTPLWECPTQLWDSNKKVILRKNISGVKDALFSPDSNSIVFITETGICTEVYLLTINDIKLRRIGSEYATCVSQNGEFVRIEIENCLMAYKLRNLPSPKDGIYNKNGELVMEGKNIIFANGRIVVSHFEKRLK